MKLDFSLLILYCGVPWNYGRFTEGNAWSSESRSERAKDFDSIGKLGRK
jgi:hypothetical protein